jgi:6-phosphogluconolactonase
VQHDLQVLSSPGVLARHAATYVAERARLAVKESGTFSFAVSGGRTPWDMFAELAGDEVPWKQVTIYQVDERVAPPDDPDRNLVHLKQALGSAPAQVRPMPVNDTDLEAAARRYGASLPEQFDLVHLGLGPDGHTASLVPGDPVLGVTDRLAAITTGSYQGRRRMTLTYPALARARHLLWLVSGGNKKEPLSRLLAGDRSIPAGRVSAMASLILADEAAT